MEFTLAFWGSILVVYSDNKHFLFRSLSLQKIHVLTVSNFFFQINYEKNAVRELIPETYIMY